MNNDLLQRHIRETSIPGERAPRLQKSSDLPLISQSMTKNLTNGSRVMIYTIVQWLLV